mmetsp:Transcript_15973/g.35957  ORF Transcript_15973/g.35957 Transcript_15973/m.35957 type:complete len:245 (+) Transcript_15973:221-955(+)
MGQEPLPPSRGPVPVHSGHHPLLRKRSSPSEDPSHDDGLQRRPPLPPARKVRLLQAPAVPRHPGHHARTLPPAPHPRGHAQQLHLLLRGHLAHPLRQGGGGGRQRRHRHPGRPQAPARHGTNPGVPRHRPLQHRHQRLGQEPESRRSPEHRAAAGRDGTPARGGTEGRGSRRGHLLHGHQRTHGVQRRQRCRRPDQSHHRSHEPGLREDWGGTDPAHHQALQPAPPRHRHLGRPRLRTQGDAGP